MKGGAERAEIPHRSTRVTLAASTGFHAFLYGLDEPVPALYALFAPIALGLLSSVPGSGRQRAAVILRALPVGLVLVALGTVPAARTWAALLGMLVVGFLLAFAAITGPRPAGAAPGGPTPHAGPRRPTTTTGPSSRSAWTPRRRDTAPGTLSCRVADPGWIIMARTCVDAQSPDVPPDVRPGATRKRSGYGNRARPDADGGRALSARSILGAASRRGHGCAAATLVNGAHPVRVDHTGRHGGTEPTTSSPPSVRVGPAMTPVVTRAVRPSGAGRIGPLPWGAAVCAGRAPRRPDPGA
ncbi:hypothetical protein GCM10010251_28960 [Streptomyces aurantiogriseus]|uniref:Uncharacterized protein n=1 Tax=Streptomyces aurantiogriseus TaxID=66870 RepID=A0A918F5L3_9ACTN|nr:hypothetical protein GCM10010251_28960 [Streptomyces aurantiogriseus]